MKVKTFKCDAVGCDCVAEVHLGVTLPLGWGHLEILVRDGPQIAELFDSVWG